MNEEKTDKGRPHAVTGGPVPPGRPEPTSGSRAGSGSRSAPPDRKGNGAPPPHKGSALAGLALVVSLLVAAGAAGGGYWLWLQDQHLQGQQSQYLVADSLQAHLQPMQAHLSALSSELQQLAQRSAGSSDQQALARLDKSIDSLSHGQSQVQQRLAKLQQTNADLRQSAQQVTQRLDNLSRAKRAAWAEAEAGYLAFVAENRIRFYGDVDSALAALKKADELLADLGGETIEARRGIARAVDSLLEVKPPERIKLDQALGQLVDRLDDLPLAVGPSDQPVAIVPASAEQGDDWRAQLGHAWNELRGSLSKLVVVAHDRKVMPLVTPEERFFLHQNLTLELEAARFAALRGDQALYQESLGRIQDWLGTYFDNQSAAVADTRREISELATKSVSAQLPDISPMLDPVKQLGLRSAQ